MTRVIDEINKVIDSLNTNIKYTTNNKYVEKETVELQIEDVNENNIKEKLSTLSTTNQEVKQEIIENINNDILSLNVDELGTYRTDLYETIKNNPNITEEETQKLFKGLDNAFQELGKNEQIPNWYDSETWLNCDSASYNSGQCTYYSAGIAKEMFGFYLGIEGLGKNSARNITDRYPELFTYQKYNPNSKMDIKDIQPGTVISYSGSYCHVDIVLAVDYENGKVLTFDGNMKDGRDNTYQEIINMYETGNYDWQYNTFDFAGGLIGNGRFGSSVEYAIPNGGIANTGYEYYKIYGNNPTAGREK